MTWWVIQTESQREHVVRVLLMRGRPKDRLPSCETYLPRIKHRSRIAPLFPSYLFVRAIEQFYPVRWTEHVVRLCMAGDRPYPLPDAVIDQPSQTGIRRIHSATRTPAIAQRPACARDPR